MTYVISDLHGCYDKYIEMLEKIEFTDRDEMYVLGDVIDRGMGGIDILLDMCGRGNVIPILGNHEYMAYGVLRHLNVEITEENFEDHMNIASMGLLQEWMQNGGRTTMKAFSALSSDMKSAVLAYLEEFSLYETVTVNRRDFVLVHAGIDGFCPDKALNEYEIGDFLWERCDYDKVCWKDKYLVSGHTPTFLISERFRGKICMKNNHIAIDCGAICGGRLGCLRLDDLREFYV